MRFEKQNVYKRKNFIMLRVFDYVQYSNVIIEVQEYSTLYPRIDEIVNKLEAKGFENIYIDNTKASAMYDENKKCWISLTEYQKINSIIKSKNIASIVETVEEILLKIEQGVENE